jgi:hypothetical protein
MKSVLGLICGACLLSASASAGEMTAAPDHAMPAPAPSEDDLPPLGTGPSTQLSGALGDYSMMRDSSGTSWQPESTPMEAIHGLAGDWATMVHGYIFGIYDHQGGPRGDSMTFSESMLMGMAQRSLGDGKLTLRGMISLDPLMGKSGYPLLLQTGETADGKTPLVDRQHPHDFLMELSGTYSMPVSDASSAFVYFGYPGEPALGPPTFMHRFSAMPNPEAPIAHHWLDATHVTFGVLTAGFIYQDWKLEGSIFNGREPDQNRWGWDAIQLNSASGRVTWNPSDNWSFQGSYGYIKSPEQLEPHLDQHRITASAIYNHPIANGNWQTTLAWGENTIAPGPVLDAYVLESAMRWFQHTLFVRAEYAAKDELFLPGDPRDGETFRVFKASLGYVYDIPVAEHVSLGLGALGSLYALPSALATAYGSDPASYMLFTRLKLK